MARMARPLRVISRHKQVRVMSALPPKADIPRRRLDVRFGPQADIPSASRRTVTGPALLALRHAVD